MRLFGIKLLVYKIEIEFELYMEKQIHGPAQVVTHFKRDIN